MQRSHRMLLDLVVGGRLAGGGNAPWYRVGSAPAPVAAYQPIGAADLDASYINLANPGTNNAAPGVAPTFAAATGWTFNGTTQYLDTGYTSAAAYTVLVRFSDVTNTGNLAGVSGGTSVHYVRPNNTTAAVWTYMNTTLSDAPVMTSGVMGIAGKNAYRNGASEGEIAATAFSTPNRSWFVGGLNGGALIGPIAAKIQAFALYSTALSDAQMLAVSTAMAALS
jgi:hypothetical protein